MPILQRIELANFLNSRRIKPWRPDWPHAVLEINGRNAAINIPNGKGKSTMVTAILAMLTNHAASLKDIRQRFFAPTYANHFTHIRIEVLIPVEQGGGAALPGMDADVSGAPMVFGMYGNSGENEKIEFYAYQGTIEDCPVAHVHQLRHTLVADEAFLGQLKSCKGVFPSAHKERSRRAWLAYVEDFFDMSSLKQQLVYQLARGAEGGHSYFEVSVSGSRDYSASVFYARLAPELLTDVMGDLGEEGEHGIEDTIHEKVSKVIAAKRETELKAEQLRRSENTLKELSVLKDSASKLIEARQEYSKYQSLLSVEAAVLEDIVINKPIPGIPVTPPEAVPGLAKAMVMRDGVWLLPDRILAEFFGENPTQLNQRADRQGLPTITAARSQLIDFTCDSFFSRPKRGPVGSLYPRESALAILQLAPKVVAPWTAGAALDAVTSAFEWVEMHADTNPARRQAKLAGQLLHAKEDEYRRLRDKADELTKERERLRDEESQLSEQHAEYKRMGASGLFSEQELGSPAQTGERATEAARNARQVLDAHYRRVRDLEHTFQSWLDFVQRHGESASPGERADLLASAKSALEESLRTAKGALTASKTTQQVLNHAAGQAHKAAEVGRSRLARFQERVASAVRFAEVFGNASPIGLEERTRDALSRMQRRVTEITAERAGMRESLEALRTFRQQHGERDPDAWLQARSRIWEALSNALSTTQADLQDAKRRVAGLEVAVVVPGRVARDALEKAGGAAIPLHVAIEQMKLEDGRRKAVLTLFSALLHSPVYLSLEEAATAARRLADADVEAPVFLKEDLERFCRNGDITIRPQSAHVWLVGVPTRQVDCLLDPSLVEREKARERERIEQLTASIERIERERQTCSPHGQEAEVARLAIKAERSNFEEIDAKLKNEDAALSAQRPRLELEASPSIAIVIRETIAHHKEFAGIEESELKNQLDELDARAEEARSKDSSQREHIEQLEANLEELQQKLFNAAEAAAEIKDLRSIQAFVDHPDNNPAFMQQSKDIERSLSDQYEHAEKRTRFNFVQAEAFVRSGQHRPTEIAQRIREIAEEHKVVQDIRLPEVQREIDAHRESLSALAKHAHTIDEFVRGLIARQRASSQHGAELIEVSRALVEKSPLWAASQGLYDAESLQDAMDMLVAMAGDLEYEDTSELGNEVARTKSRYEAAKSDVTQHVERILVMPELDRPEQLKLGLMEVSQNPDQALSLHDAAERSLAKNRAANDIAAGFLNDEWNKVGSWLQAFTMRLPENLRVMKETFGPIRDKATGALVGAGFEIDASTVNQEDIRVILDEVVAKVEKFESTRRALEQASTSLRDPAIRSLRQDIRNTFYQKVISNPRIRVYMPSISHELLTLEKNMVSTGQGVAMTLLWLVRMGDYITEREIRRMTTAKAQRRRVHRTLFAIMDGAFSSLSKKELITDALESIQRTRGRFQLIVTGHDEAYKNNFKYFPTLVEAREIGGQFMFADSQTKDLLEPEAVGMHAGALGVMDMRIETKSGDSQVRREH